MSRRTKANKSIEEVEWYDRRYVELLPQSTAQWDNVGSYSYIADHLDILGDAVHLDIGSGDARLLEKLRGRFQRAVLLGVERNPHLIRHAEARLKKAGIPAQGYVSQKLTNHPGGVRRTYLAHHETLARMDMLREPGPISFIADDIRSGLVVRQVLGDRKLDSASFTFPGFSDSAFLEESPHEDRMMRVQRLAEESKEAAYIFMATFVKPGGVIALAERHRHGDPVGIGGYEFFMGRNWGYWNNPVFHTFDLEGTHNARPVLRTLIPGTVADGPRIEPMVIGKISILFLKRNSREVTL